MTINKKEKDLLLNEILGYIEDIEDIFNRLRVKEFYANINKITDRIVDLLAHISNGLKKIIVHYPNLNNKIKEKSAIDYIELGKTIEEGYWIYNYKNIWNAAKGTNFIKKVLFELD